MKNIFSKLMRFWSEDRSLSVMMVLLLSFIFVLIPFLRLGRGGEIVIKIFYSVMLLTGILSIAREKRAIIIVSIFAIVDLFISWVSDIQSTKFLLILNDLSSVFFNLIFAVVILVKTFQPGEINFQRIQGSIVVYLLAGLMFAFVFHAVYIIAGPSSFNNISETYSLKEFLYFSFTSLTTMGYGDITPVHPMARSLANFEALIGQLYPAILIARLVSMEFESSMRKKKKDE